MSPSTYYSSPPSRSTSPPSRIPNEQRMTDTDALLVNQGSPEEVIMVQRRSRLDVTGDSVRWRGLFIRSLALFCACCLSVGSHYGTYILSPLKSRIMREMGTSNTEFSLLIAAFSLNSTWTPLVGGVLAASLGTTLTSILATGIIFIGLFVLLIGDLSDDVRIMTLGMFIFGLGVSPVAVVQETIIVRFFKSHSLGLSMALGLVVGKASSFVSARTSYPLSQRFGPHAPFYTAAILALFSFGINLVYLLTSKWLVTNAHVELEAPEIHDEARRFSVQDMSEADALKKVAQKRRVKFTDLSELGDVFWAYIGVNVFCGAVWHPFIQLAPNIIQLRYNLTELDASTKASYMLVGSIFLYPTVGFIIDRFKKKPYIVIALFTLSSILTMIGYIWLVLPPTLTRTPVPTIASFAAGNGFSPLLLVVIVPQLVPMKFVATTLGAHKALEQTGTTISQTLAGLILDAKSNSHSFESGAPVDRNVAHNYQMVSNFFLALNIVQFLGVLCLWYLSRRQRQLAAARHRHELFLQSAEGTETSSLGDRDESGDDTVLDPSSPVFSKGAGAPEVYRLPREDVDLSTRVEGQAQGRSDALSEPLLPHEERSTGSHGLDEEVEDASDGDYIAVNEENKARTTKRGVVFSGVCLVLIVAAWVLFMVTAWLRLRSKQDREGRATNGH